MDGYSVQEAASVLGVAEGRVWELLARGVLLGTPEGDSMRVYLKAQSGPIATAGTRDEPPRTNGNGGSHAPEGEASAFRELLTEFRNLTERYGQALLALGEARGEVAGLRSRVDQLETRLDLRIPPSYESAPVAWESATIPAAPPQPTPAAAPPTETVRRSPKPRKARSPREATAGFADALARALDPSAADLRPPPTDSDEPKASAEPAAATVAELEEPVHGVVEPMADVTASAEVPVDEVRVLDEAPQVEAAAEVPATPAAVAELEEPARAVYEPPQLAVSPEAFATADGGTESAEAEAVVATSAEEPAPEASARPTAEPAEEAAAPTYSAAVVEPDWFADGDFAWLDAADLEVSPTPESAAEAIQEAVPEADQEPPSAAAEPVSAIPIVPPEDEQPEPAVLPEPELPPEPPGGAQIAAAQGVPIFEGEDRFEPELEFESWRPPGEGSAAPDLPDEAKPQAVGSAVAVGDLEEEVMWLGSEPGPVAPVEPPPTLRAEAEPWPAVDIVPRPPEVMRPPLAMTEDELARLALDEGWDEAEVAAIRAMITPIPSTTVDLPGAAELHEAMAALEAVPVRVDPTFDVRRQWAKPAPEDQEPVRQDDWAFGAEPVAPPANAPGPPSSDVTSALRRSATDAGWLRRGQGPAAAAYRRLRRLFPG